MNCEKFVLQKKKSTMHWKSKSCDRSFLPCCDVQLRITDHGKKCRVGTWSKRFGCWMDFETAGQESLQTQQGDSPTKRLYIYLYFKKCIEIVRFTYCLQFDCLHSLFFWASLSLVTSCLERIIRQTSCSIHLFHFPLWLHSTFQHFRLQHKKYFHIL